MGDVEQVSLSQLAGLGSTFGIYRMLVRTAYVGYDSSGTSVLYNLSKTGAVKSEIFARPFFREFRDLDKFAKITGREYSNGNRLLSTSLIEPNTKLLVTGNAH